MNKRRAEKAANKGKKRKKPKAEKKEEEEEKAIEGEDTGPNKVDFDEKWNTPFDEEDDFYDRTKPTSEYLCVMWCLFKESNPHFT